MRKSTVNIKILNGGCIQRTGLRGAYHCALLHENRSEPGQSDEVVILSTSSKVGLSCTELSS